MDDDGIPRVDLAPPPGGLARLQAALDRRATRRSPRAMRVYGLAGGAALAVVAGIAAYMLDHRPARVFARRLDAALHPEQFAGAARERGIVAELSSRDAEVRIIVSEPLPNARARDMPH